MWKYPSDIRVSENCIGPYIINGRKDGTKTTFPVSRRRYSSHGNYLKLPLNGGISLVHWHLSLKPQLIC